MSLISDALKTAQRERAGRAQSAKDPEPMLDGFFPYVASEPTRSRSRLVPVLAISSAAVVLLAITAFLMWPRQEKVTPSSSRVPVVLPPRTAVSQSPRIDSSSIVSSPTVSAEARSGGAPQAASRLPQADRLVPTVNRPVTALPPQSAQPAPADAGARAPATEVVPQTAGPRREIAPAVTRIDYEAQATALFNAGDLPGAREKFLLATRYAPSARAWTNYGVTLQRLGDNAGAAAAYQSAIGIDANYLEAWLYQGRLAADLGDTYKATPLFQRARTIDPRNADVNVELAKLEYDAKNYTEARRFADDAARAAPSNSRAHWYVGVANDGLRDVEGAIRGYTSYLQTVGTGADQAQFVGWARQRLAELKGKP